MRYVFVKNSEIPFAGEGLWAKIDIKVNEKNRIKNFINLFPSQVWFSDSSVQWC